MPTRVCPVELHLCDRPGCGAGFCEMAQDYVERALMACAGCGGLVVFHHLAICIDCEPAQAAAENR